MILKGGSENFRLFCYGNEASDRYACMNGHLPTANQSEIREAYLNSVPMEDGMIYHSKCGLYYNT